MVLFVVFFACRAFFHAGTLIHTKNVDYRYTYYAQDRFKEFVDGVPETRTGQRQFTIMRSEITGQKFLNKIFNLL
jgi:hypothetical protein